MRFASLAFFALYPLVSRAFEIISPTGWLANTTVTVEWTSVTTDAEFFSIFLVNPVLLPTGPIGIADTIDAYLFEYDIPLPRVPPGDGYTIIFTNTGDIDDVYATSTLFPVIQNDVDGSSPAESATTSDSATRTRPTPTGVITTDGSSVSIRTPTTRSSASETESTGSSTSTANAQPSQFGGNSGSRTTINAAVSLLLGGAIIAAAAL